MKCSKCGASLPDGIAFCTECGTPIENPDTDRTTIVPPMQPDTVSQTMNSVNTGQPSASGTNQQTMYGQPGENQPPMYGQPGMNQQTMYGQPGMNQQTMYGQPGMNQQGMYGQPGMNQQGMYGQPGMNQQAMYGQPGMNRQGMYGQPAQPRPKKPHKPLSKKAKGLIIGGAILAVLLVVFFVVVLPILLKKDLQGSYKYKEYLFTFSDGTYTLYDSDMEDYCEIGNYTVNKKGKVELTPLEGGYNYFDEKATFDSKENILKISSKKFSSKDEDAKTPVDIPDGYMEDLNKSILTAIQTALGNEDVYEEAEWWYSYDVYGDSLKDPDTDMETELAKNLDYSNNKILQFLLEEGGLDFYFTVDTSSGGDVDLDMYFYGW